MSDALTGTPNDIIIGQSVCLVKLAKTGLISGMMIPCITMQTGETDNQMLHTDHDQDLCVKNFQLQSMSSSKSYVYGKISNHCSVWTSNLINS